MEENNNYHMRNLSDMNEGELPANYILLNLDDLNNIEVPEPNIDVLEEDVINIPDPTLNVFSPIELHQPDSTTNISTNSLSTPPYSPLSVFISDDDEEPQIIWESVVSVQAVGDDDVANIPLPAQVEEDPLLEDDIIDIPLPGQDEGDTPVEQVDANDALHDQTETGNLPVDDVAADKPPSKQVEKGNHDVNNVDNAHVEACINNAEDHGETDHEVQQVDDQEPDDDSETSVNCELAKDDLARILEENREILPPKSTKAEAKKKLASLIIKKKESIPKDYACCGRNMCRLHQLSAWLETRQDGFFADIQAYFKANLPILITNILPSLDELTMIPNAAQYMRSLAENLPPNQREDIFQLLTTHGMLQDSWIRDLETPCNYLEDCNIKYENIRFDIRDTYKVYPRLPFKNDRAKHETIIMGEPADLILATGRNTYLLQTNPCEDNFFPGIRTAIRAAEVAATDTVLVLGGMSHLYWETKEKIMHCFDNIEKAINAVMQNCVDLKVILVNPIMKPYSLATTTGKLRSNMLERCQNKIIRDHENSMRLAFLDSNKLIETVLPIADTIHAAFRGCCGWQAYLEDEQEKYAIFWKRSILPIIVDHLRTEINGQFDLIEDLAEVMISGKSRVEISTRGWSTELRKFY